MSISAIKRILLGTLKWAFLIPLYVFIIIPGAAILMAAIFSVVALAYVIKLPFRAIGYARAIRSFGRLSRKTAVLYSSSAKWAGFVSHFKAAHSAHGIIFIDVSDPQTRKIAHSLLSSCNVRTKQFKQAADGDVALVIGFGRFPLWTSWCRALGRDAGFAGTLDKTVKTAKRM